MKLVLDDQIRWPERRDIFYGYLGQIASGVVIAGAVSVRPKQPVTITFLRRPAKQRPYLSAPRHHGKLVHRRDQHGRGMSVDFFVHYQNGNAHILGLASAEITSPELVTTIDQRPANILLEPLDLNISTLGNFGSTPWAGRQLCGGITAIPLPIPETLNGLMRLFRRAGCNPVSDPKPNRERCRSPLFRIFTPHHFHCTHKCRSPLKLLECQKTKRISHDHGKPPATVQTSQFALQAADGHSESRHA